MGKIEEILIAPAIFAADGIIKKKLEKDDTLVLPKEVCSGRIMIRKFHNGGAAFSSGRKNKAVTVISSIFSVIMTIMFFAPFSQNGSKLMRTGLSLMLGGAYSNTYDRLKRGYVVDYLSFKNSHSKYLSGIVYNISDFCIAAGALIIVLDSFRESD